MRNKIIGLTKFLCLASILFFGIGCDAIDQSVVDDIVEEAKDVDLEETENKAIGFVIDSYIKFHFPDSHLIGYGEKFAVWGRDQNVDPRLMVAIARQESRFATDPNACGGRANELHNAWGLLENGNCIDLVSWDIGIESIAKNLVKHYFNYNLLTVEQISTKYCQSNCGDWSENVSSFMEDLGGNPNDLTFHTFGELDFMP